MPSYPSVLDRDSTLEYARLHNSGWPWRYMSEAERTFGRAITAARKKLGWRQKELAAKIRREDEEAISPQYLNDIEHDRRSPSSDRMIQQFAAVLGIEADWLYYLAGKFPADLRERKLSQQEVAKAMAAFRGKLKSE